jgi:tRNA-dihydrouridine synthase A
MLGLRHGLHGARKWRQVWSDHRLKPLPPREVWALAQAHVGQPADVAHTDSLVSTP